METLIIPVLISFFMGLFGYFIARFWILPIGRYRRIKQQIAASLKQREALVDRGRRQVNKTRTAGTVLRTHAIQLNNAYHGDLPHWYKILLHNRGESPEKAAKNLMALPGIHDPAHTHRRIAHIRENLNLKLT